MDISVVIPVHQGGRAFEQCLEGLAQTLGRPAEIIVVPDGETDGVWRKAEAYGAQALEPTPVAQGPAHARNRGARVAQGEFLFFVDADVVVHPNVFEEMEAAFAADPSLDALIGSYDDAPAAPDFFSQYRNLLHHYVHQQGQEEAFTFWGACGVVRRAAFWDVGGFDAARFPKPSVEDIDLGYRLKAAGYRLGLRKTLLVKHLKRWTLASIVRTDVFQRALPWTALLLASPNDEKDLNLDTRSRTSVATMGVLLLALAGAFFVPVLGILAGVAAVLLLVLNAALYRFFWKKRGFLFMLGAIACHGLYFLYGGAAFVAGWLQYHLGRRAPETPVPA